MRIDTGCKCQDEGLEARPIAGRRERAFTAALATANRRRQSPVEQALCWNGCLGERGREALALRWHHVDLATGTLFVINAKTDAVVRAIDLTEALREELVLWRAESSHVEAGDYVLAASTGRKPNPSNLRRDVLRPAVEAANAKLERDGIATIPTSLGFHGLRRTYASLRCTCGDDIAYTSSQLGHEDPRFTLKIYA